jgi:hypothetical protein
MFDAGVRSFDGRVTTYGRLSVWKGNRVKLNRDLGLLVAGLLLLQLIGCGSANQTIAPVVHHDQTTGCNDVPQAGRRAPLVQNCGLPTSILDGDSLMGDAFTIDQIVAAGQDFIDPCDAVTPLCFGAGSSTDTAGIVDGPASSGDNCTTFTMYQVGGTLPTVDGTVKTIPTPSGPVLASSNNPGTIVNQGTLWATDSSGALIGAMPLGWVVYTSSEGAWFTPNATFAFGALVSGSISTPPIYRVNMNLPSVKMLNAIRGAINVFANSQQVVITSSFVSLLQTAGHATVVPCYTKPLQV